MVMVGVVIQDIVINKNDNRFTLLCGQKGSRLMKLSAIGNMESYLQKDKGGKMNQNKKDGIQIVLGLLKNTLIKNGVSMGFLKDSNELFFFGTNTYLETSKFNGFKCKLEDLVK